MVLYRKDSILLVRVYHQLQGTILLMADLTSTNFVCWDKVMLNQDYPISYHGKSKEHANQGLIKGPMLVCIIPSL